MQGSEFIYIDKNQNRLTISSSVVTRMDPESILVCCFHAKRDYKCVNARKSPLKVLWSLYPDWFGSCESCKDSKFHLDCFMSNFKKDETAASTQSSEVCKLYCSKSCLKSATTEPNNSRYRNVITTRQGSMMLKPNLIIAN